MIWYGQALKIEMLIFYILYLFIHIRSLPLLQERNMVQDYVESFQVQNSIQSDLLDFSLCDLCVCMLVDIYI